MRHRNSRLWPTARFGRASSNPGRRRGYANIFGVRYTFNCFLWFNNFEHLLAALLRNRHSAKPIRRFDLARASRPESLTTPQPLSVPRQVMRAPARARVFKPPIGGGHRHDGRYESCWKHVSTPVAVTGTAC
jgi:hypothetical protein